MVGTQHRGRTSSTGSIMALGIRRISVHVAVGACRVGKCAMKLSFSHLFPRTFGVLLRAAHAGSEVLQAVHMQSSTPIAGRQNTFPLSQAFHPVYHLDLVWATIIFLCWLTGALTCSWQKARRRVGDWHRRVHH
jgi:hypothetical protein